jgi:hypothetical protein
MADFDPIQAGATAVADFDPSQHGATPVPDFDPVSAGAKLVSAPTSQTLEPTRGSDAWYLQKIGSLIPESATPVLSWLQRNINAPLDQAAAKGADIGREIGSDAVSTATMLTHPDYLRATLPSPYGPKPPVQFPDSLASEEHPVAKGVAEGVGAVAGGAVADPRNWPFLASSAARPILQQVISGGFAAQMGTGAVSAAQDLHANWDKLTPEERSEKATQAGLSALMAAGAGIHAATGGEFESTGVSEESSPDFDPSQHGATPVPGPGAQNLGTGVSEAGSDISQLGAAMKAGEAPSVADRVKAALDPDALKAMASSATDAVSEKASDVADASSTRLDRVKAVGSALWNAYSEPPEWTDFKDARGKWDYALQRSSSEAMQFAKDIKAGVPDELTRAAMVDYVEAGGDDALLKQRASELSGDARKSYDAASEMTDDQRIKAQNVANYFDSRLKDLQDAGMLKAGVENYVNHIWERENPVTQKLAADIEYGSLATNPSLLRERIFSSYFDGEKAGLVPKNKDIGFLITAYDEAVNKAIASRAFIKSLLSGKAEDGKPLVVANGDRATVVDTPAGGQATLISPKFIGEQYGNYRYIDHPALQKWTWIGKDSAGKPIFQRGDLWVHPDAYDELSNNLSTSKLRQWTVKVGDVETKPIATLIDKAQKIKGSMLGYSLFHQVQEGVHAVGHWVNPFNVGKVIDFDEPAQRTLIEHGLQVSNGRAQEEFMDGHNDAYAYRVPVVGRIAQQYSDYLFHDFIPNLKMKTGLDILERNTERYSGKYTADQIAELSAKQANAAYGELNYRQMGRNKTLQDTFRLLGLAPDFLEARARFVGQALRPEGAEQRVALARLTAVLYGTARVLNMTLNNGNPRMDKPFAVTSNGKDYFLRSVPGDIAHLVEDPRSFIYTRLNPTTTKPLIESLFGRDEFGRKRALSQTFFDTIKGWSPIAVQKWIKNPSDYSPIDGFLQAVGLTSVKSYSAGAKAARDYVVESVPKNSDEGLEKSLQTRDLQQQYAAGKLSAPGLTQKVQSSEITEKQARKIASPAQDSIVADFSHLPIEKSLELWPDYAPDEQQRLLPTLRQKAANIDRLDRTSTQKVALKAQVRAALTK